MGRVNKTKPVLGDEQKRVLGMMAGNDARKRIEDACAKAGLTVEKVAKTIVNGLDAEFVKVQLDMKGQWKVSKKFVDHHTRLKAVERAEVLLDLKPTEKVKVDMTSAMSDEQLDAAIKSMTKGDK